MHSDWDIDERKIFGNSGVNLHIGGIVQGWESGIIQILKENISELWKQQKKLRTGGSARFSKNLGYGNRTLSHLGSTKGKGWLSYPPLGLPKIR